MLNLIQANSQTSLRGAALVATKQSIKATKNGLLRRFASPRNDVSLVFENGKLLQSYGKSQGGKPITIGYNSNDQQYFSFTNKGSSNTGSIYDAISGSTQGKYSAGLLQSIACPVSASSGTPPPPPLPKLPSGSAAGGQPLYSFNTAASNEIALPPELLGKPVPPITVPKDIPPSNKPAAEPTEFKWTEEGMASLLATGKTKDELDVKLQEIIQGNPKITQKIEEHGGYDNLKRQLVEIAKELFGVSEAQAAPIPALVVAGGGLEGAGFVAATETIVGGAAAVTAIMNTPKNALVSWLFENIGDDPSGQILKIALTLAAKPESVINITNPQQQNDFEKRKHDDNSNKPSTSKQQQKVSASATFMPDPGDLEPDDDQQHRKSNCEKSESPIWKELENYKGGIKTNGESGAKTRFYEWDYLHNEIEVYGPKGKEHLGAMCPRTGRMIKEPKIGRTIRQKVN
ncbi:colicin E3/pyocin S6 family cytotoxin [Candidatus Tisiphia endosymbiont of Hybos culiciformis]|uniref:colicin E3/pyocin S6 family cytotoxin n=1 Tax=Candidatus Tisiphia endosymbiont of Hybos culiciformis TaxID=3139331 RepID=UPI003CCA7D35